MDKIINIGIIGFGTVGTGVCELIKKNSDAIAQRSGIRLKIKSICDINTAKIPAGISGSVTDRWSEITGDNEIDIVIELVGGISPAREIILDALKSGKKIVTANKKLLAEKCEVLLGNTTGNENPIGFEAAVGGGIPCILALRKGMIGNRIKSILGILNGTSNYILTRMDDDGMSFDDALRGAQAMGFAEADPAFDIEGTDAGHKISILAMLAFGRAIEFNRIPIEGITQISQLDISYARDMGYVIKLLGIAKLTDDRLDIRVHPTMIPKDHPLASVRNEFNSIMFDGDMTGAVVLNGRGAGSLPTASAVVSDIVQLASGNGFTGRLAGGSKMVEPEGRISRYYMRLCSEDSPGILSKISGVLGDNNISIASVMQKEGSGKFVPLIILTHEANESMMLKCIQEIENFKFVREKITFIRVEDFIE